MIALVIAWFLSNMCPTETAWIEPTDDGSFAPVCGDANGAPVEVDLTCYPATHTPNALVCAS